MTAWPNLSTRGRRRSDPTPAPLARLARFAGDSTSAAGSPGTGDVVRSRAQSIAYGYHAVIEQIESGDGRRWWCTLAVQLRQAVPTLQIVSVNGVEVRDPGDTGDAEFDAAYRLETADIAAAAEVFGSQTRQILLAHRVRSVQFQNAQLVIGSVDGLRATVEATAWLDGLAAAILLAAPSPLPRGLYGPCPEALSLKSAPPRSPRVASRR